MNPDVRLDEITSSANNEQILQRLRDGNFNRIFIGVSGGHSMFTFGDVFFPRKIHFIGRSEYLGDLNIVGRPEDEGEEQQMIHTFCDAIARSRSIQEVSVELEDLSNDGFGAISRALDNSTQLERFSYDGNRISLNDCVMIRTLLGTGALRKLKKLSLSHNIGDAGVAAFAHGFRSIGSSLKELELYQSSIGSEGLSTLAAALTNCTHLERLDLSEGDFSMAAVGLRSLSDWLQTAACKLDELILVWCEINDEGLRALTEGALNHCKHINLSGNRNITVSGWGCLSTAQKTESCGLENLGLTFNDIEDDGAEVLARGLVGNKTLKCLHFSIAPAGWSAFSKVMCDTSTINNTYVSNHTIQELWEGGYGNWDVYYEDYYENMGQYESIRQNLALYLQLNKQHPQHAAKCKILMHHPHLDMAPLLQWELKFLPLAVGWFERAKPCSTLSIGESDGERKRCLEESDEEFGSRILTALYQFVRGAPKKVMERRDQLILVAAYDNKIAMVEKENERLRNEIKRLREIAQSARKDALRIIEKVGEECFEE
ncbi:hypothetical protein ACHAWT_011193 [Skeletonema menzelii]